MATTRNNQRLVKIYPGSIEWQAWIKHHRGSKTELRMQSCLAAKPRPRPWLAPSKMPPTFAPSGLRGKPRLEVAPEKPRPGADGARLDAVIAREEKRAAIRKADVRAARRRRLETDAAETEMREALTAVSDGRAPPPLVQSAMVGTIVVVDPSDGARRIKVTSLRDDTIGRMYKRGHIGKVPRADARLDAARRFQALYEKMEIGGARAIDYTRPIVSGGIVQSPDTSARRAAVMQIKRLDMALGHVGARVLRYVLIDGFEIGKVAQLYGATNGASVSPLDVKAMTRRLVECLDTACMVLGVVAPPGRMTAMRAHPFGVDTSVWDEAGDPIEG